MKLFNYFYTGADYSSGVVFAFWSSLQMKISFGLFCDILKTYGGIRII